MNPNLIQDGPTERPSVISLDMVVASKESEPSPGSRCSEPESPNCELTLPFGMELDCHRCIASKGLNHHGPVATILCISDHEGEQVGLVRDGPRDLRDRALSSGHQLDCVLAKRYREMGLVDEPHGLEGLDDPAGERGSVVLLLGREEDA